MAIVVAPRTINGPSYLRYSARGWTARQRRLLHYCGGESSGSGKSLESRQAGSLSRRRSGKDDETEASARGLDGLAGSLDEPAKAGAGRRTKGAGSSVELLG